MKETVLPELKGGERLRLTNGMTAEVVKVGGRKARAATEYDEPVYRLRYLAGEKSGWHYPECLGSRLWLLEDLAEVVAEVLP